MSARGPWMERLRTYVDGADAAILDDLIRRWESGEGRFRGAGRALHENGKKVEDGFSSASQTGPAARRGMQEAGAKTTDKSDVLKEAIAAMMHFRGTLSAARTRYAELAADLPKSHGPAPDRADYPTKGIGVNGEENTRLYEAKKAEHAANEAKIAHAETEAAAHVGYVDDAVREDEPKVRALFDDGTNSQPLPPGTSGSQPGSYSQIQASKARMAKINSGTLYPDGMGHEILERERENIKGYEAENKPEWNGSQWVNADGSPAPATSYAMVETADGLAPLAGGSGGMSALAVAGGGALLGAGVAKAVASKFGGGAGRAATAGAASRSAAAARSAAAKSGATGARAGSSGAAGRAAGARGAGSRAAGAGARGAGAGSGGRGVRGGAAGAGSRAGRGGAGAAGGRGGRKKDDQRTGQDQDWQADYTDDWTEDASDVLDPNASRGWVPNATMDDGTGSDKNRRS